MLGDWSKVPTEDSGTVYFVERDGFVKIGYTANLEARLYQLGRGGGSGCPDGMTHGPVDLLAAISGNRVDEGALHRRFAADRWPKTEWFYPSEELLAHIESLLDGWCEECERGVSTFPCGQQMELNEGFLICHCRRCPRCGEDPVMLDRWDLGDIELLPSLRQAMTVGSPQS